MNTTFTIETYGQGLYDFTRDVKRWLDHDPSMAITGAGQDPSRVKPHVANARLLTLFIQHTSASLLIQENADPEVQTDLSNFFQRLVPRSTDPSMSYLTHTNEGADDMPAHIKAALLPTHLSIPVIDGHLTLGTWQGIYLFEHRDAPHRRSVVAQLM